MRRLPILRVLLAVWLAAAGLWGAAAGAAPRAQPSCHEAAGRPSHPAAPAQDSADAPQLLCCLLHCATTPLAAPPPGPAAPRVAAALWRLVDDAPPLRPGARIERPPKRA